MIRLFHASSKIHKFQIGELVYLDVPFIWYVNREAPPAPLQELVLFEKDLPKGQRRHSTLYLAQCLTKDELAAFTAWLWDTHRTHVQASEVPLPLAELPQDITLGFSELPGGALRGHLPLHSREDYGLSFRVVGYFDATHCQKFPALTEEMKARGVTYLKMALKSIGQGRGVTTQQLVSAVEALYDGLGLAVTDREALMKRRAGEGASKKK
jgi:hypothetical protein